MSLFHGYGRVSLDSKTKLNESRVSERRGCTFYRPGVGVLGLGDEGGMEGDNINKKGGEERDRMEFEKVEDIYSMSVRNYNVHGREVVGDIEQGGGESSIHPTLRRSSKVPNEH